MRVKWETVFWCLYFQIKINSKQEFVAIDSIMFFYKSIVKIMIIKILEFIEYYVDLFFMWYKRPSYITVMIYH